MFRPLAVYIGLRYTRARRRNHFISFISLTSMLGIALGVTALITVLSVMNGFEAELRSRILGMTAHATVLEPGKLLRDWEQVRDRLHGAAHVRGSAPFVEKEAMATHSGRVQGLLVRGILPDEEPAVSIVAQRMSAGQLSDLEPGAYRVILGAELARALDAVPGDRITLVAPQPAVTPAGIVPRLKQFTVSGVFDVGMHEYDSALALVHMRDAATLFRYGDGISGVRLELDDLFDAPRVAHDFERHLNADLDVARYAVVDWTRYHVNFFRALRTEKTVMFVILTLIVAVAAFNIVSTLVMLVTDKQSDIAILRTLGMSPRAVMGIFVVQGMIIGMAGTLLGVLGGVWLATHVEGLVKTLEAWFHVSFLPADVYYISDLPAQLRWADIARIGGVAFALSLVATLYPAWQAARTQPVDALRYE
ncbi:MAG: lipoprotein-releasing ABC transporter permease subunit [Gammaproteobacteria bacterium]|nr:lipoprotein-releasing ABC transporter permease subunit [Gammaproteobacteria bacterium]